MHNLADWLDYIQRQHPRQVELGLERVREVAARLGLSRPAPIVITVGGTNGKGSTVALLEAMLSVAGHRVGAYTSPHLFRYSERVRIAGREADDLALCEAFARVESARAAVPLTYFEFGTLAALDLFERAQLDVAVLEVGLGGRLDAVNLVDADVAIVTTVDFDHQDWLGSERGAIAREKAGIFRRACPAIIGDRDPPLELIESANAVGARLERFGQSFEAEDAGHGRWRWRHRDGTQYALPAPALAAFSQRANAACAIAALHALGARLAIEREAIASGIERALLPARLQRIAGPVEIVVDVAHNPQAAREVAAWLQANPPAGSNLAVFAALSDKDVAGIAQALTPHIRHWFLAGLDEQTPRGLDVDALAVRLGPLARDSATAHAGVAQAFAAARAAARPGDRVVVFGSFYTAASVLRSTTAGIA
jgi:dihydrofolate synthase/folylpolyglutamate synthase